MNLFSLAKDVSEHFRETDLIDKIESIKSFEGEGIYSMIKVVLAPPHKDYLDVDKKLRKEFPSFQFLDMEPSRENGAYSLLYHEKA